MATIERALRGRDAPRLREAAHKLAEDGGGLPDVRRPGRVRSRDEPARGELDEQRCW